MSPFGTIQNKNTLYTQFCLEINKKKSLGYASLAMLANKQVICSDL